MNLPTAYLLNAPKKLSNGDAVFAFVKLTSRGGTGGAGGAVTLPIKKGKNALSKMSQPGTSNLSS